MLVYQRVVNAKLVRLFPSNFCWVDDWGLVELVHGDYKPTYNSGGVPPCKNVGFHQSNIKHGGMQLSQLVFCFLSHEKPHVIV